MRSSASTPHGARRPPPDAPGIGVRLAAEHRKTDPPSADRLYAVLKAMPAVAGVSVQRAMIRSFQDTVAELLGMFTLVLVTLHRSSRSPWSTTAPGSRCRNAAGNWRAFASGLHAGRGLDPACSASRRSSPGARDPARLGGRIRRLRVALGSLSTRLMRMPLVAAPRSYILAG